MWSEYLVTVLRLFEQGRLSERELSIALEWHEWRNARRGVL